jgi:hypothetical protein
MSGLGTECIENDRVIFRESISGVIVDAEGKRCIKRTGGFWNCYTYEFSSGEDYPAYPPEPRLTWHLGFLRHERVESDGFSGIIVRERVFDQVMIRLGDFEWRCDLSQGELYFPMPKKEVELRTTLLAYRFFHGCTSD